MNLKIASATCMRDLSERSKSLVLQNRLDEIQEQIKLAATKAETEIYLSQGPCDEIIDVLKAAGYQIEVCDYILGGTIIKW